MTTVGVQNGFLFGKDVNTHILDMSTDDYHDWGHQLFELDEFDSGDIPTYFKWDEIKRIAQINRPNWRKVQHAVHIIVWASRFFESIGKREDMESYMDSIVLYWEGG